MLLNLAVSPTMDRTTRPTIYIVDDDPSILDLVRRVCSSIPARIETFTSARSFLEVIGPQSAGCLILDYELPDLNGLEILDELQQRGIVLPAIFISGRAVVSTAVKAFKAGTMDFLEKPFEIDELRRTAERAVQRDAELRAERALYETVAQRHASLTPREKQVLDLVVAGKPNKAIATDLGVSPKTVEVHRANVMQKMQAESLAELVQMAVAFREGPHGRS